MGARRCALTLLSPSRCCPLLQELGAPIPAWSDFPPYSEVGGDARITTSREMHFKSRIWKESCLTPGDWHRNGGVASIPKSTNTKLMGEPETYHL